MNTKRTAHYFLMYTPVIMAMTCAAKVLLEIYEQHITMKVLNVLLNAFIVIGVMCIGKTVGFCWKHRFICYTSLLGYCLYSVYIVFSIPKDSIIVKIVTISYAVFVISSLIILKKRR